MKSYRIILTPLANEHLRSITEYISYTLQAPDTALRWLDRMEEAISTLAEMPMRFKLMDDEPWHSSDVRRMPEGNHYVYYRIEDAAGVVRVLAVVYARSNQQMQLGKQDIL